MLWCNLWRKEEKKLIRYTLEESTGGRRNLGLHSWRIHRKKIKLSFSLFEESTEGWITFFEEIHILKALTQKRKKSVLLLFVWSRRSRFWLFLAKKLIFSMEILWLQFCCWWMEFVLHSLIDFCTPKVPSFVQLWVFFCFDLSFVSLHNCGCLALISLLLCIWRSASELCVFSKLWRLWSTVKAFSAHREIERVL